MNDTPQSPRRPLWQKVLFAVPLFGWIARDLVQGGEEVIWYALIAFLSAWGCAFVLFGLPGLYLPALALVPVIFIVLILITFG